MVSTIKSQIDKPEQPLKQDSMDEQYKKLREAAKNRIVKRVALKSHITVYVIINALLFLINTMTGGESWWLWPLAGWGLGLVFHLFAYVNESSGGLAYHIFSYIVVNIFLMFIDFMGDNKIGWVFWPISFWGLGLLCHIIYHIINMPKKGEDVNKSWMDRKIERELEKSQQANANLATYRPNVKYSNQKCPECGVDIMNIANFCPECGKTLIIK
jgi:predicted RNA-binding Zn-ribbon protein involved in translation (DUF1610 family)